MDKGPILDSWKQIAGYLGRDKRTCQRWERELGLPIHRLNGSPKARVFAYPDEIERWRHEHDGATHPNGPGGHAAPPILPRWIIVLVAWLIVLAIAASTMVFVLIKRQARIRWANEVAVPEIERLSIESDPRQAYALLEKVEKAVPHSPHLARLWPLVSATLKAETSPPGAEIWVRPFGDPEESWVSIGLAPVAGRRLPAGYAHWKAVLSGYAITEGVCELFSGNQAHLQVLLDETAAVPQGMNRIPGGTIRLRQFQVSGTAPVKLADFWIDRHEVTNRQFKVFVDAGGYMNDRYWKHAFRQDGRILERGAALALLVDRTGRPGPATWEGGTYPDGADDYPVTGVSWYEAAAYAEFTGKELPSVYHWNQAANPVLSSYYIIPACNIEGRGLAPVGSFASLGPLGTYDMFGNAAEWCANESEGRRVLLGGSWKDTQDRFSLFCSYPPIDRPDDVGFRCMKSLGHKESSAMEEACRPIVIRAEPDYSTMQPCSDEVFEAFRSLYAFTRVSLDARIEDRLDWSEETAVEKVSFASAEGTDRFVVHIFMPKKGRPPFQSIVYFPGAGAALLDSVFDYGTVKNREIELITRSGRAVVFPTYYWMFERRVKQDPPHTRQFLKDRVIRHCREVVRTLDYLETRPDFDKDRIAFQGLSWGGWMGPIILALEKRFKAANLVAAGFYYEMYVPERGSMEWDLIHFLPRVRTPVLVQNARFDAYFPMETNGKLFFQYLGTPDKDKSLLLYPTGHAVPVLNSYRKDMLEFFDQYLGPVTK